MKVVKNTFLVLVILLIFILLFYFYKVKEHSIKSNINDNIQNENSNVISSENTISNDTNTVTNQNKDSNNMTPVELHGQLSVKGSNIIDKNGDIFQLKGVSTHGIAWFPEYINKQTFLTLRDDWKVNTIRIALYSDPNSGYTTAMHEKVKEGVNYATELGLYVIIDWHILSDGNPNTYKSQATAFFKEMASLYKDNDNILYEICNEPNGDVKWSRDIKPYAESIIKEIRNIDNDSIILCGTPTWSQDVDVVANDPINGYENIMYTLHFYAATHKADLRNKAQKAIDAGLPLFVSEFGICDASGNGSVDESEANKWIDFLNTNNISWICWNLSNKNESSALLSNSTNKVYDWSLEDLSIEGKWLLNKLTNN